jgi:hypothetical protein
MIDASKLLNRAVIPPKKRKVDRRTKADKRRDDDGDGEHAKQDASRARHSGVPLV